jgi:3-oxoacyl-ACP reductase-like protein
VCLSLVSLVGLAWTTGASAAKSPKLQVTAVVTPKVARVGQTIVATATVKNSTGKSVNATIDIEFTSASASKGWGTAGPLAAGASIHKVFKQKITAGTAKGAWTLVVTASAPAGTSRASAKATVR